MKLLKLIALILLTTMIFTILSACNNQSSQKDPVSLDDKSNTASANSTPETSKGPLDHLETKNLDKDIVFLVNTATDISNGYRSIEICPNEESEKYSYLNEYTAKRNKMIEDKLGVRISEKRTTDMVFDINSALLDGGNAEFQIVVPWVTDAAPLVTTNAFYDLMTFDDIINFDAPYWDQNANENLLINKKLYFTTGDFSMLSMDVTHCMVFNKDVVAEKSLEDPYKLVSEGKWTFDKMMELSKSVTADTDGTPGMTYKDSVGLFINSNFSNSLFIGAGQHFITKDSSGTPVLSIYSDTAVDVVKKITDIFHSKDAINIESFNDDAKKDGYTNCYWAARAALAEKRALFTTISLSDIISIANTHDANFGLLVTPKFSDDQSRYYSYISVIYATCCAIPTFNPDPETAALVLEALSASSTNTVKKQYYDRILKAQKINDAEGEKMLDFIFDNRIYDLGAIYNWGKLRDFLIPICIDGTDTFTAKYSSEQDLINEEIKNTLDFLK